MITGRRGATELVRSTDADIVLNGITGSIGLEPTLAALRAGRILALANKESLVAGGSLVVDAAAPGQIVPVDSEHSALAQCLRGGTAAEVARLVVTASGGPVPGRGLPRRWPTSPPPQALAHPTWAMGPVVTINSATLVNKGLEVIEAHLLFGIPYDRIDVVVHPQSVIHSMVTFVDGSTLAQASPPDMKLPIALALAWPHRLDRVAAACDFGSADQLDLRTRRSGRIPGAGPRDRRRAGPAAPCRRRSTRRTRRRSTPSVTVTCVSQVSRTFCPASWTRPTTSGATRGTCTTSGPRKTGPGSGPGRSSESTWPTGSTTARTGLD